MVLIDDILVQRQTEILLAAATPFTDGSIKLYVFGECEVDETPRSARFVSIGLEDLPRQRGNSDADVARLTITFETAVSETIADPSTTTGSTRSLIYISQVIRQALIGQSVVASGHTIEFTHANRINGLGTNQGEDMPAQNGLVTIFGRVTCETASGGYAAAPDPVVDGAG